MTSIVAMKHFQQTTGVMPTGEHASVMMSLYPVYVSSANSGAWAHELTRV